MYHRKALSLSELEKMHRNCFSWFLLGELTPLSKNLLIGLGEYFLPLAAWTTDRPKPTASRLCMPFES